jgi:hypothetical protein
MDRGRLRRLVRGRRASAGRRSHPAGHSLPGGGAAQPARHRHHARARGPHRRVARLVAAPESAGLRDAVHGGADFLQALCRGRHDGGADHDRAGRRAFHARAVRHRHGAGRAFDPRKPCAGDPHQARQRAAHRRLEDRSDAGRRPADRRGEAARVRRRGRARHRRRLDQRGAGRALAVRAASGANLGGTDRQCAGPRRGDDVREPGGAHPFGGGRGRGLRARGRAGRPLDGARDADRARDRLPRRHPGIPASRAPRSRASPRTSTRQ